MARKDYILTSESVSAGHPDQACDRIPDAVLHPFLADDEGFVVRFRREARIVATLRHPNIVQVFDFDYHQGLDIYYMVMEFISGPTLKSLISDKPLEPERAIRIGAAIADALDYAHTRDMIHRDIKPANVMFIDDEQPVLTDFGIAKMMNLTGLTASGAMVGTPAYMAPEVGIGKPGTAQSDIYSLSVMIYQMLTGHLPFDADTPMGMVMQHINDAPPPLRTFEASISPTLESTILRALEKDPADRYAHAGLFAAALRDAVGLQAAIPSVKPSNATNSDAVADPADDTPKAKEDQAQGPAEDIPTTPVEEEPDPIGELLTPSDELAQPWTRIMSWIGSGLAALLILSVITLAVWLGIGGELPTSVAAVMPTGAGTDIPNPTATPAASPTADPTQVPTPSATGTRETESSVAVAPFPHSTPRLVPALPYHPVCNPVVRVDKEWIVPDETVPPNTTVIAYVTLDNPGSCPWPDGSELVLTSGQALGAPTSYTLGSLAPRETVQVLLPMQAPEEVGTYTSVWRVRRADGPAFGGDAVIEVIVEDLPTYTPTPLIENEVVTATPTPLEVQPPEILAWTESQNQNLWSGTLSLQATGGTGEYRFYRDVIREDTHVEAGTLTFEVTRCEPLRLEFWVLSGSESARWQGEIAYPDPEACP